MKVSQSLLLAAIAGSSLVATVHGDPVITCAQQSNCISWTTVPADPATPCNFEPTTPARACTVKVCLKIDLLKEGCVKTPAGATSTTETLSHVCDGADANGCPRDFLADGSFSNDPGSADPCAAGTPFWDTKCNTVPNNFEMCQYGSPGETLSFIVKDGNENNGSESGVTVAEANGCGAITCGFAIDEDDNVLSCGATPAQADKERLWTYTIPGSIGDSCGEAQTCNPPPPLDCTPCGASPTCPLDTACCVDDDCDSSLECISGVCKEPGSSCTGCDDCGLTVPNCGTNTCNCNVCVRDIPTSVFSPSATDACTPATGNVYVPTGDSTNTCYQGTQCSANGDACNFVYGIADITECDLSTSQLAATDDQCIETKGICRAVSGQSGVTSCEIQYKNNVAPCTSDADDVAGFDFSSVESRGICHAGDKCDGMGLCKSTVRTDACRTVQEDDCCDVPEFCPATVSANEADNWECPEDGVAAETETCRPTCEGLGCADPEELCDGTSKKCPPDVIFEDSTCIYAGQNTFVGEVGFDVTLVGGVYTAAVKIMLTAPLATGTDESGTTIDAIKVYGATTPPGSNPGSYNSKWPAGASEIFDGVDTYTITFPLAGVCTDDDTSPDAFYFAVHLDMASGDTAWALPCSGASTSSPFEAKPFIKVNPKTGKETQMGWGNYWTYTPCCKPADSTCGLTCPSDVAPGGPTPPGSGPSPAPYSCQVDCNGDGTVETLTCPVSRRRLGLGASLSF